MALEDWWRDHTQGVQQDLLTSAPETPTVSSSPIAGSPPREVPAAAVIAPVNGSAAHFAAEAYASAAASFIGTCPDCGSQLEFAEGCVKCHVCGFSECG